MDFAPRILHSHFLITPRARGSTGKSCLVSLELEVRNPLTEKIDAEPLGSQSRILLLASTGCDSELIFTLLQGVREGSDVRLRL